MELEEIAISLLTFRQLKHANDIQKNILCSRLMSY